jgi:hypothetical protein
MASERGLIEARRGPSLKLGLALQPDSPELEYLLASWGSRMPYRRAADLLGEILPLHDSAVAQSTVRRHALEVGSRLDA